MQRHLKISPSDTKFLQSSHWESICIHEKKRVSRVAGLLYRETFFPLVGKYWYIPRGPQFANSQELRYQMDELLRQARQKNIRWIRIEPISHLALKSIERVLGVRTYYRKTNIFVRIGIFVRRKFGEIKSGKRSAIILRKSPLDMQPEETFSVDISISEQDLLKDMKSKTRYNIRLARKKGVDITFSQDETLFKNFFQLVQLTAKRAGIRSHAKDHYQAIIKTLPQENWTFGIARYKEKIVAMTLLVFYDDVALYLHGGSMHKYREIMAPHALQWEGILEAKRRGMHWYDFGGVDYSGNKEHWFGITRFKVGFSPETKPRSFPGTFDLILDTKRYRLYQLLQLSRKVIWWFHRVFLKHLFIVFLMAILLGGSAFAGIFFAQKNVESKVAFIGDIHRCSANEGVERLDAQLEYFAQQIKREKITDIVVLGDVTDLDDKSCKPTAVEDRERVDMILRLSDANLHYALGFGDVESSTESERQWLAFSGNDETYFSVDLRGAKLLVLDTVLGGWSMREECDEDTICHGLEQQRLYFKNLIDDPVKRREYQKEYTITKEEIYAQYDKYKALVKREQDIIKQTRSDNRRERGFVSQEQILWVKRELDEADTKFIFVASHHPLFLYENGKKVMVDVKDREKLLDLLSFAAANDRITQLFSGNIHKWKEEDSGGILYHGIDEFQENGSWAVLSWYMDGRFSYEQRNIHDLKK